MKRIVLYILLLIATSFAPVRGNDVGRLRPVQVVQLSRQEDRVTLRTDTEDVGKGATAQEALENLKATTAGIVYLDTARYLLVEEAALADVESLRSALKPRVEMCLSEGTVLGEETAAFLRVHGQLPQLKGWVEGAELPLLTTFEKRLILTKKSENLY